MKISKSELEHCAISLQCQEEKVAFIHSGPIQGYQKSHFLLIHEYCYSVPSSQKLRYQFRLLHRAIGKEEYYSLKSKKPRANHIFLNMEILSNHFLQPHSIDFYFKIHSNNKKLNKSFRLLNVDCVDQTDGKERKF